MLKIKKKDLNQPTTLGDFQELAEGIAEIVVTKDEFNDFTKKAFKTFTTKDDLKDLATKQELTKFKSDVLDKVDAVFHEVKAMREEQSAKVGRDDRQDQNITKLKTRVNFIERQIGIEPAAATG